MIKHEEIKEDGFIPGYIFPGKRSGKYGKTWKIHTIWN